MRKDKRKKRKKCLLIPIFSFCTVFNSFSQAWDYQSARDQGGGKQRIAYIVGKGGQAPYTKPLMQVIYWEDNGNVEISFSNLGYTGCGGDVIKMKFDGKDIDYIWKGKDVTTDAIAGYRFLSRQNNEGIEVFLVKLMQHETLTVRIKDDCGQNDYTIPLTGSYSAINYVFPSSMLSRGKQELDKQVIMTVINTTPAFKTSESDKEMGTLEKGTVVSAVKQEKNGRLKCYFSKLTSGEKTSEGHYQAWIRERDLE